jgi:hypothetical protein
MKNQVQCMMRQGRASLGEEQISDGEYFGVGTEFFQREEKKGQAAERSTENFFGHIGQGSFVTWALL